MSSVAQPRFSKRYNSVSREKAGGATYTPVELANFVADKILGAADLNTGKALRLLDPAVGDGELLVSLVQRLQERNVAVFEIVAFDTNPEALSAARARLSELVPAQSLRFVEADFLPIAARAAEPSTLFNGHDEEPFDIIIANPPYVRTQIMGAEQAQKLTAAFALSGRVDLYHAFLLGIASMLSPKGVAGIIVSNRFMTTRGGGQLRGELLRRLDLSHVWDLGDTKLFGAAVLPAVLVGKPAGAGDGRAPRFTSIYETSSAPSRKVDGPIDALADDGVVEVSDGRRFEVKQGVLEPTSDQDAVWRISTGDGSRWLDTVDAQTWKLFGDIGKIRVGVKTCADRVFISKTWATMPEDQRPELSRALTTHHIAGRFARSKEPDRFILYPHASFNGNRAAVDIEQYPRSLVYLTEHRASLEGRSYLMEAGRRWYELWVPQDPSAWARPKLIFRDISERPTFWLDLDGTVVNGDCYWLVCDDQNSEDLLWLAAAVANSTFAEQFYDHRFNNKLYGGRRRFITQYVELFPLPDPTTPTSQALIALARRAYNNLDDREAIEAQIDTLVFQAFGLVEK